MRIKTWTIIAAALALVALLPPGGEAQFANVNVRAEFSEPVDAPIFFEIAENDVLANAETSLAKGRQGRWEEALPRLQGLIEQYGGRLVLIDEANGRYMNFASLIFAEIAGTPQAVRAYRARFDGYSGKLLSQARDEGSTEPLVKIIRNYFPSSHTGEAYLLLAEQARERADFETAEWCLKQITVLGASADVPQELVAARLASCLAGLGDAEGLKSLAAGVSEEAGKKEVRALNKTETLREYLDALLKETSAPGITLKRSENGPYSNVPSKAVDVSVMLFSRDLGPPEPPPAPGQQAPLPWHIKEDTFGVDPAMPYMLPYYALFAESRITVVHDNIVEVFDGSGAYKWEKHSFLIDRAMATNPFGGAGGIRTRLFPYDETYYPTVRFGSVFAVIDSDYEIVSAQRVQSLFGPSDQLVKRRGRRVACFDLKSGKEKWMTGGAAEGTPLREVNFCSPPAFIGGASCAIGYTTTIDKSREFTLYALETESGRLLWKTSLFTQDVSGVRMGLSAYSQAGEKAVTLLPVQDGGHLYVATDAGASMCVSVLDGRVEWLVRYKVQPPMYVQGNTPTPQRFWHDIRPLLFEGKLIVASADSSHLVVHDAATGEIFWKWDNDARQCQYLLGVSGGAVWLAGKTVAKVDLRTGKMLALPYEMDAPPLGRPCMSSDYLYWPTRNGIITYDLKTMKFVSAFSFKLMSRVNRLPEAVDGMEQYAGNLTIGGGLIIAVSPVRISAYGRK